MSASLTQNIFFSFFLKIVFMEKNIEKTSQNREEEKINLSYESRPNSKNRRKNYYLE